MAFGSGRGQRNWLLFVLDKCFCKGSSKKFSIKKLYVDAKVKKVRLGIMQGDEKNPFFVKKIYIKGKKTKLTADKSMKTIVCTVKGAKAIVEPKRRI